MDARQVTLQERIARALLKEKYAPDPVPEDAYNQGGPGQIHPCWYEYAQAVIDDLGLMEERAAFLPMVRTSQYEWNADNATEETMRRDGFTIQHRYVTSWEAD